MAIGLIDVCILLLFSSLLPCSLIEVLLCIQRAILTLCKSNLVNGIFMNYKTHLYLRFTDRIIIFISYILNKFNIPKPCLFY